MNVQHHFGRTLIVGLMALTLAGCAGYDRRENNTMVGAGLGAATGAIFSGGDPLYTLGGAAAGGLLGNILTEDRYYRSDRGRHHHRHRGHRHGR